MEDDLVAAARLPRAPELRRADSLRATRLATAMLCVAFVAGGIALHSVRYVNVGHRYHSALDFLAQQIDVLGLEAVALTLVTVFFGLFYGRELAPRLGVASERARAVHMTLAGATITTIALHIAATAAGSAQFRATAAGLLVPLVWSDRFPHPMAAGVLGFWLIALFGLSYFIRNRVGGYRRWRILHRVVLAGVALSILHTILMAGWIPGWAL